MFFIPSGKTRQGPREDRKNIYKRFRGYELMDKKRAETALRAGEDRAILLGLTMVLCSLMMFFVLCITVVRSYADSVWTEESVCTVLNSSVVSEVNCSYSCGPECWRTSRFPCLHVHVTLNATGRRSMLSLNEESKEVSSECFYVPKCHKDLVATHLMIMNIWERLKSQPHVACFFDRSEQQEGAILAPLYGRAVVFQSLFWPSCMLAGGTAIVLMVKLTQYLSIICEQVGKVSR
ncbi:calcium-activated potassium channel subunit beta-2-like [Denticeps clupeoides]|uniref:Uncharacterized protein n=1 Tax=Denticeps clupeoides TaxID=299321 RepID=A0AAY4AWE0_9TELE|nr:calcium-activated potassium channel subunit beta-2-like [Denticeps clupeoides]XP_028830926.1 calcium-activated potassium channel subunit beta-2-like [Denticeps clupeoides]